MKIQYLMKALVPGKIIKQRVLQTEYLTYVEIVFDIGSSKGYNHRLEMCMWSRKSACQTSFMCGLKNFITVVKNCKNLGTNWIQGIINRSILFICKNFWKTVVCQSIRSIQKSSWVVADCKHYFPYWRFQFELTKVLGISVSTLKVRKPFYLKKSLHQPVRSGRW